MRNNHCGKGRSFLSGLLLYYWGLPNIICEFAHKVQSEADSIFELHAMGGYDGVASKQLGDALLEWGIVLSTFYRLKMPNNIALISKSNRFTDVYKISDDEAIGAQVRRARLTTDTAKERSGIICRKLSRGNKNDYAEIAGSCR